MLKRIKYYTMSSLNRETAPAYNIKVYNLGLTSEEQNKLYSLMEHIGAYDLLNEAIEDFNAENIDFGYVAGINGRSGGYLVLYKKDTNAGFEAKDVPPQVLRNFRALALRIRKDAKWLAKNAKIRTVQKVINEQIVEY